MFSYNLTLYATQRLKYIVLSTVYFMILLREILTYSNWRKLTAPARSLADINYWIKCAENR